MFTHEADIAFILGAGFSKESKLPTTREFADGLLDPAFGDELDLVITRAIKEFLTKCFLWEEDSSIPSFEDMFTMIDISAGTGHNIGRPFAPKRLRAVRRMLIYRLFSILDRRFEHSDNIRKILDKFVGRPNTSHFVVLNWDIVLERHLYDFIRDAEVNYCVDIAAWNEVNPPEDPRTVGIAKIHGSSNWVYCDNCRSLFFEQHRKLALAIRAGLIKSDFRSFDVRFANKRFDDAIGINSTLRGCRNCQTAVGSHIATFSFRKSFRTHGFASSWLAAEQILTKAKKWIFLGYSLPDADFEFKNLLKTCQLKWSDRRKYPKEITVVTRTSPEVEARFRAFFGSDVHTDVHAAITASAREIIPAIKLFRLTGNAVITKVEYSTPEQQKDAAGKQYENRRKKLTDLIANEGANEWSAALRGEVFPYDIVVAPRELEWKDGDYCYETIIPENTNITKAQLRKLASYYWTDARIIYRSPSSWDLPEKMSEIMSEVRGNYAEELSKFDFERVFLENETYDWRCDVADLAERADLLIVAPAGANIIAELALGLGDNPITEIARTTSAPLLIAPALSKKSWNHLSTQTNVRTLKSRPGIQVIEPQAKMITDNYRVIARNWNVEEVVSRAQELLDSRKIDSKRNKHGSFSTRIRRVQPNDKLAAIVGPGRLLSSELVDRLWRYINKNGCQDKRKRIMINADDTLRAIFGGEAQVSVYEMTRFVFRATSSHRYFSEGGEPDHGPTPEEIERQLRLERMAKGKTQEAIKRLNERLNPIRHRVIAAGRATPKTVDSVIYNMDVDDFVRFRGEFLDLSRVDFKPKA